MPRALSNLLSPQYLGVNINFTTNEMETIDSRKLSSEGSKGDFHDGDCLISEGEI
jgi:hypothetical protein